jgi:hypothetical protein
MGGGQLSTSRRLLMTELRVPWDHPNIPNDGRVLIMFTRGFYPMRCRGWCSRLRSRRALFINVRRPTDLAARQQAQFRDMGPDDYHVIQNGRDIGRIFKPGASVPPDHPWMWTITATVVVLALPSHGFCASLDEAKAKFADTWRAWVALHS